MKIFFGSRSVERVLELPQYTIGSFLASLGGATSLYLGASFVVLFELFEILLRLGLYCIGYNKLAERKK